MESDSNRTGGTAPRLRRNAKKGYDNTTEIDNVRVSAHG